MPSSLLCLLNLFCTCATFILLCHAKPFSIFGCQGTIFSVSAGVFAAVPLLRSFTLPRFPRLLKDVQKQPLFVVGSKTLFFVQAIG